MDVAFARVLRAEIQSEIDSIAGGILNGGASSFEEYRHLVGKKLGLETALAIVDDLSRRFDEQN